MQGRRPLDAGRWTLTRPAWLVATPLILVSADHVALTESSAHTCFVETLPLRSIGRPFILQALLSLQWDGAGAQAGAQASSHARIWGQAVPCVFPVLCDWL